MANQQPDPDHGLFRVEHFVTVGNNKVKKESDLIFDYFGPLLVLEWKYTRNGSVPRRTLRLERAQLIQQQRRGYFSYEGPLQDPHELS